MEREGSIFLGLEKYLHASPPMRSFSFFFSTCRLAAPRRSLVSSVSAIPSPYSEVSTVCSDFRALPFFPLSPSFFPTLALSLLLSLFSVRSLAFWPTCIGKYESFVPSALSGTCVCHEHTQAKTCSDVGKRARVCVRAAVCSQVVTKIDRGELGARWDEKTERPRDTGKHTSGVEDGQTDALSDQTMIYHGYVRNFHN